MAVCAPSPALVVPDAFLSIFNLVFLCSCSWMVTLSVANCGQFLYRSGDPRHGFVVMNRLSTENLVEPITRDLEIQLQAPFLLYKNAKCELSLAFYHGNRSLLISLCIFVVAITGVWFYEESECTRIAKKLEALVKEETRRRRPNLTQQEKSNVDILSLLTKAHGEYEQVDFCFSGFNYSSSLYSS